MGAVDKMLAATKGLFLLVLTEVPSSSGRPMSAQVFEVGDMVFTAGQLPQELRHSLGLPEGSIMESSGVKNEAYRWPGGILNYEMSNAVSSEDKTLIRNTLSQLETKLDSCIKFREADSGFRVIVKAEGKCSSSVGYNGNGNDGSQDMSLDAGGCMDPGTIEHEFYHAIGVWHTQSRTDRDDHVKINYENIINGTENGNFFKYSKNEVSEFGLPYDFESVMHYSDTAFSKNEKKTIETIDPSKQDIIGKSNGVSEGDILLVKKMYGCTDGTPPSPPTPTTGLIDQVEGNYVQSSPPASNDWHYVSISKKENVFTWKNKAGVEWDLVFSGEERDGAVRFEVGDKCLYKKDGYTEALLSARGDSIEIKGPSGMFTKEKK